MAILLHGGEHDLAVFLERRRRVLQRKAILLHGGEHDRAVCLKPIIRELEREAALLHGGEHDLAVGLERIRRGLERKAVLLHGGEYDVAVGLERLRRGREREAVVLHGGEHVRAFFQKRFIFLFICFGKIPCAKHLLYVFIIVSSLICWLVRRQHMHDIVKLSLLISAETFHILP